MKYWQWSSDRSCVRITRCMSVSINSYKSVSHQSSPRLRHLLPYLNEINLGKALVVPWLLNVQYWNDILMVEVSQKFHLSQGSQTEHRMIKRSDLLDCDLLPRGFMKRWTARLCQNINCFLFEHNLPDHTISSFSDHILNVILIRYIERDLPRSARGWVWLDHICLFLCTIQLKCRRREYQMRRLDRCSLWQFVLCRRISLGALLRTRYNFLKSAQIRAKECQSDTKQWDSVEQETRAVVDLR